MIVIVSTAHGLFVGHTKTPGGNQLESARQILDIGPGTIGDLANTGPSPLTELGINLPWISFDQGVRQFTIGCTRGAELEWALRMG
jgi:hypothetical protein